MKDPVADGRDLVARLFPQARWVLLTGSVITSARTAGSDLPEKIPYVARQVPELLHRQIPAAPMLAHGPVVGGGYAWMQPRLPGRPASVMSAALLDQLLRLLDRMRDAPAGEHRSDIGR